MLEKLDQFHKTAAALLAVAGLCACGDGSGPGVQCGAPVLFSESRAYVANNINGTGSVSAYFINTSTGALSPALTTVAAGANPNSIVITPGAEAAAGGQPFAYVANSASANISGYGMLPPFAASTSGAPLVALAGSPFPAGAGLPRALAVHGSGNFLYLASSTSNVVSAFSINPTTGALAAIGAPVAAGTDPMSIAIGGNFAYTANATSNDVSAFAIDVTTGALSTVGPAIAAGATPQAIAVEPKGRFAYVANFGSNDISAYSISATTGALTSLGATVQAGPGPIAIGANPTGNFLYAANFNSNDVSVYSIGATGTLTAVGLPVVAGNSPRALAFDPDGKFLYVVNLGSASISAFSINATTGALTNAGTTVSTDANPFAITTKRRSSFVTPC